MQYVEATEKPGIVTRIKHMLFHPEEDSERRTDSRPAYQPLRTCHITVRRQVLTFGDAAAAADGLKLGQQQIVNLVDTDPALREKIKDFLSGVNHALEGVWEEVGQHIYLIAPSAMFVEVAPATPRMTSALN